MLDLVISIDSTGSMGAACSQVKQHAEKLVTRLFADLPDLQVSILSHGNYCDANRNGIVSGTELTADKNEVMQTIKAIRATGGGGQRDYRGSYCTACYELVMKKLRGYKWRDGSKRIYVMIGDENPSHPSYGVDWEVELKGLVDLGVTVYGVHCLNLSNTRAFYQECARRSDGIMVAMNQFTEVTDLILAISYREKSPEALVVFSEELQLANRMSRNMASAFAALSGKSSDQFATFTATKGDLEPVDPQRFQVLDVTEKCDIKSFVIKNGATFKIGRGFYEFTKTVDVQKQKEVILVDKKSGDIFSGKEARRLLNLDEYGTCRVHPSVVPDEYTAFIQSTSVNRVLLPGTKFLYELDHC